MQVRNLSLMLQYWPRIQGNAVKGYWFTHIHTYVLPTHLLPGPVNPFKLNVKGFFSNLLTKAT